MSHERRRTLWDKVPGMCIAFGSLTVAFCVLGASQSQAGALNIIVESTNATPGTSGSFDVDLQNNSASAVTIAGFSVDVLLSSTTNATFTAIDNATTAPYIFSITGSFPPGFSSNLLPMEAAGSDLAASSGQVVNPGDTWGLAHVSYLVAPAAPLGTVIGISLEPNPVFLPPPAGTSLFDSSGAQVQFSGVNGTITISSPTTTTPAPSTLAMLSILFGMFGAVWSYKRLKQTEVAA